jgi:NAD(P)-dependent dehydrogenase (short-subunit alcohol dehydrogenase family)
MYNPYQLTDKTILVTGASSGIGRATAIECSKLGAKLVITARNEDRLKETFVALEGCGHQMIIADLTNSSDMENLVANIPELDGLVNDAGIAVMKPVPFIKQKDLEEVVNINTFAPVLLTGSILKKKKLKRNASVVMVSSVASMASYELGNSIYGLSKSAIKTFAEYCAMEVKNKGIRVNSVHPGMVATAMTQNTSLSATEEMDFSKYIMNRCGKPTEIALAIAYLLSDATQWMTGSQLVIDGGAHLT